MSGGDLRIDADALEQAISGKPAGPDPEEARRAIEEMRLQAERFKALADELTAQIGSPQIREQTGEQPPAVALPDPAAAAPADWTTAQQPPAAPDWAAATPPVPPPAADWGQQPAAPPAPAAPPPAAAPPPSVPQPPAAAGDWGAPPQPAVAPPSAGDWGAPAAPPPADAAWGDPSAGPAHATPPFAPQPPVPEPADAAWPPAPQPQQPPPPQPQDDWENKVALAPAYSTVSRVESFPDAEPFGSPAPGPVDPAWSQSPDEPWTPPSVEPDVWNDPTTAEAATPANPLAPGPGVPAPHTAGDPFDGLQAGDVAVVAAPSATQSSVVATQSAIDQLAHGSAQHIERKRSKGSTLTRRKGEDLRLVSVPTDIWAPGRPMAIAFTSPKGGVGKSTTSTSCAAYIAESAHRAGLGDQFRVLLIDGDVASGNLAFRLAKTQDPNMVDLLDHIDAHVDPQTKQSLPFDNFDRDIGRMVLRHPDVPNLHVLAAPENPKVLEQIYPDDLSAMFSIWSTFFQVVVFDTGTQLMTEHTNGAWLQFASQIFWMVEPEVATLRSTKDAMIRAQDEGLLTFDQCRVVSFRSDAFHGTIDPYKVVSEFFSEIPRERLYLLGDFYADAVASANNERILSLESPAYAEQLTPIIRGMFETHARHMGR